MQRPFARAISFFLIFSFLLLDFSALKARAGMIDTATAIATAQHQNERARITAFLGRQDVQQALARQGVVADEAAQRVSSLSDAEVISIAQALDQLPAGGNGIGTVVGAALFVFIILLITDILGYTDVFYFVNHRR
ncbi:MAG: PA2779 family protein [Deltaproteobacteria bacterium]|nr:PA2779 family protein [Deltaproteobacteria bacterium]